MKLFFELSGAYKLLIDHNSYEIEKKVQFLHSQGIKSGGSQVLKCT